MKPIFFAYRNGGVRRVCPLVATVVSFTATLPAVAADANWLGNTDASMANGANWDSSPVSGDVWLFGAAGTAGGTLTNDLATSSSFQVGGISFGAAASAYTLSGGAFTLAGNIVSTSANAASIGAGITVSGARQVNLNGTSGVTLTGNLSGSGSLTQTAGGSGAKTLALSGDNSGFTGTFTQTNDSNNRTAFNAATAGSANAAWDLNRNVNGGVALNFTNSTIHFGALSGGAFIRSNSNGTVNVSVGALGTDTTFGGAFQQANGSAQMSVIKVGAGNLTLTGGSTHTAGTIVNGGTLTLARGGGSGAVRGQITVNAGATVKTTVKDALGYTDGSQVSQVNLVGGTFDNAHADNQGYATQFNLTGGTVGSTGGGSINFFTGYGIASNAAVSTSIVSAPVTLRGGNSMNVAVADGAASVDLEISGAIGENQGTGGIEKTGAGTLVMSGINTYAGSTLVSAGTLFLSGSLGTGTTQVAAGATIGGTGNIAGHLVFESGAKLDLTGATLGLNSSDILSVGGSGSITLVDFTFSDIVGWDAAAAGDGVYTLVDGGASVTFGGATPTASSPHAFSATRFGYFSEGSLQAVIYTVPEPDAALLAGCLGALVLVRRRHR